MNLTETIAELTAVLQEREALEKTVKGMLDSVKLKQRELEERIAESGETVEEVPEIIARMTPFTAWKACEPAIGACIDAAMAIKHERIAELENSIKGEVDELKQQYELLEGWALQELERSKSNNSSSDKTGYKVHTRVNTRYNVNDKTLLMKDAIANSYADSLTITVRQNSKAMAEIIEERKELPPGMSMDRVKQAVFTKGGA